MPRRVTLKDVADRAGVGVATVDRVLNDRSPVTPRTAERVLAAAQALNYHAHGLMRRRVESLAPPKTLGFVLQKKGKWLYQTLAEKLRIAAGDLTEIRASVTVEFVETLSPEDLAAALSRMRKSAHAIALVALDHPTVNAAIGDCAAAGVPVFALLSQLNAPDLAGYVGIDGRKAGRTAGWAMSRLTDRRGEVGILIGSHRYLAHEDRESGFRSYLREHAPDIRLRDSVVYLDDAALAYEAAAEILTATPSLIGLYQCGGGVEGVSQALREAGRAHDVFYICHEQSPPAIDGLIDGTVDLLITNPLPAIVETVTRAMAQALTGQTPTAVRNPLPFHLMTPENL